ncbi:MAG: hypothetical protein B6U95_07715 [Thermofilum sp. ex4484_82]|nr:MAG: hypothetical protein B6U95_07715 [Thermofilum sp. ex4484_82]OYT36959.1 MAG: hypothetical protein B6U96_07715 [Archaeoglobales archaeon ex4484_92]
MNEVPRRGLYVSVIGATVNIGLIIYILLQINTLRYLPIVEEISQKIMILWLIQSVLLSFLSIFTLHLIFLRTDKRKTLLNIYWILLFLEALFIPVFSWFGCLLLAVGGLIVKYDLEQIGGI